MGILRDEYSEAEAWGEADRQARQVEQTRANALEQELEQMKQRHDSYAMRQDASISQLEQQLGQKDAEYDQRIAESIREAQTRQAEAAAQFQERERALYVEITQSKQAAQAAAADTAAMRAEIDRQQALLRQKDDQIDQFFQNGLQSQQQSMQGLTDLQLERDRINNELKAKTLAHEMAKSLAEFNHKQLMQRSAELEANQRRVQELQVELAKAQADLQLARSDAARQRAFDTFDRSRQNLVEAQVEVEASHASVIEAENEVANHQQAIAGSTPPPSYVQAEAETPRSERSLVAQAERDVPGEPHPQLVQSSVSAADVEAALEGLPSIRQLMQTPEIIGETNRALADINDNNARLIQTDVAAVAAHLKQILARPATTEEMKLVVVLAVMAARERHPVPGPVPVTQEDFGRAFRLIEESPERLEYISRVRQRLLTRKRKETMATLPKKPKAPTSYESSPVSVPLPRPAAAAGPSGSNDYVSTAPAAAAQRPGPSGKRPAVSSSSNASVIVAPRRGASPARRTPPLAIREPKPRSEAERRRDDFYSREDD